MPPLSASLPSATTPTFCTDEDIVVRAGSDWSILCPQYQQMAIGTDGVFANGVPWVLTSASVDFGTQGVKPNQVVHLTSPKANYPGGGQFLAIDSVSGNSITLRRVHKDLNVGQPPAPTAGLTGVTFAINTLDPQIEEATYDLKSRFMIDDTIGQSLLRNTQWIYDVRVLRTATVLTVLYDRYTQESRTDRGDFERKVVRISQQLAVAISQIQIRWGPWGNSSEPSTIFSCRVSR